MNIEQLEALAIEVCDKVFAKECSPIEYALAFLAAVDAERVKEGPVAYGVLKYERDENPDAKKHSWDFIASWNECAQEHINDRIQAQIDEGQAPFRYQAIPLYAHPAPIIRQPTNELATQNAMLREALEELLEMQETPPDRNCSCHISPPCSDCVDYGGIRSAIETAKEALAFPNLSADYLREMAKELAEMSVIRGIDDRFGGRLALMLECAVLNPNGYFDDACRLLDEYKAEWEKVNPSPPTFMGEPIPQDRKARL